MDTRAAWTFLIAANEYVDLSGPIPILQAPGARLAARARLANTAKICGRVIHRSEVNVLAEASRRCRTPNRHL
jgi:hypothetical protein